MVDNTFLFRYVHVVLKLFCIYYLYSSNLVYVIIIVIVIGSLTNQVGNCICEKVSEKVWDQFVAGRMQVVALSQKWKRRSSSTTVRPFKAKKKRKGTSCFWRKRDLPKEILPCIFHLMREVGQRGKFWSRVVSQKMFKHWRKKWLNKNTYMYVRTENL